RAEIEELNRASEEQRRRLEAQSALRAEAEARLRQEKQRHATEEQARLKAEEDARRLAGEAGRRHSEAERQRVALEDQLHADHQARMLANLSYDLDAAGEEHVPAQELSADEAPWMDVDLANLNARR